MLLTDGYNEDDHDNNRAALLAHLARPDIRVFTITYRADADLATLAKIAQATNARSLRRDRHRTTSPTLFRAALANF